MSKAYYNCFLCRRNRFETIVLVGAFFFLALVFNNVFGTDFSGEKNLDTLIVASARTPVSASASKKTSASNAPKNAGQSVKKETVVLDGNIDGEGTFTFREGKVFYQHSRYDYPKDVVINGRAWTNLDEPFDLGFAPDYVSSECIEKNGRNIIRFTLFSDRAELYIYDSDGSSAQYHISMVFSVPAKASKSAANKNSGDLISLPEGRGKESKNKTPSAATAQPKISPQPNEMLLGIVYDLKRTKDLKSQMIDDKDMMAIIKKFVNGSWQPKNDKSGAVRYSDLENYYCLPTRLGNTFFYMEETNWSAAPKLLRSESLMNAGGWIAVYSGYVVAPFSGKFRFVGFGDDFLCVRFNKQIVLDYGWSSATMGMTFDSWSNFQRVLAGEPETDEQSHMIKNSPFFSKYRLEILPVNYSNKGKHGLQRGPVLSVQKGQVIPIEILFADVGNGEFSTMLFVEQLDSAGRPKVDLPKKLPLFRTTKHLPAHPKLQGFPDFEDGGPIWKVVDFRGKPIPANQFARQTIKMGLRTDDDDLLLPQDKPTSETKKTDSESSTSSKKKQTSTSSTESQRNPNIQKTVSKTTRGNTTTETITKYNGDTIIETVTTNEVNGDTMVQTTTTTETKNGKVVKQTSTTTTTEKSSATPTDAAKAAEEATKDFASAGIINLPGGLKLEMVKVEAGTFMMSAKDGDNYVDEIEHQAALKRDYFIGRMEITQAQWKSVMGSFNPSRFILDDLPVDSVTWNEAMEFCEKLNTMGGTPTGWMFTLPTETQWEYAARGGKNSLGYKYSGSNNIDDVAWYSKNSGSKTHPVGKKEPNELGLYDMTGNVSEWCLDDWIDKTDQLKAEFTRGNDQYIFYRSNRGGGWDYDAKRSRCASRYRNNPDFRHHSYGFRVALVQPQGLANASNQDKMENTGNKISSSSGTSPKKNNPTYNPFGYTSPLMEDD